MHESCSEHASTITKSQLFNAALGSAKILNIARSAGPRWILGVLNPQEINFVAKFALHGILTKIMIFHENLQFHDQISICYLIQTFSNKFSGISRVENLIRHILEYVLTRGN